MITPQPSAADLASTIAQYLSGHPGSNQQEARAELHRFVRWYGQDQKVDALTPADVARYAEEVAAAGGDVAARLAHVKEFLAFLKRAGFVRTNLATHVKSPKTRGPATLGQKGEDALHLTSDGYKQLREEVNSLKGRRETLAEEIRTAAADKDFRENAPLEAAREGKAQVESRIVELEERLKRAVVMEKVGSSGEKAVVGARVALQEMQSGRTITYTLVDSSEANPSQGKISVASPVGKALLGRRAGEEVEVVVPKGAVRYRIQTIHR